MAIWEREKRGKGPGATTGLLLSIAVHAGLVAAGVLLHKRAGAEPDIRFTHVIEAKIVKLGEELPEKALPRLAPEAPPPPQETGVPLTDQETPTPEPEKEPEPKKKPQREKDLEEELFRKLKATTADRGRGRSESGDRRGRGTGGPTYGAPGGDPEGEVVSARDQIQGNLWAGKVRRALHRAWAIPEVIPDADLRRLEAIVVIRFDAEGNIRSHRFRKTASGNFAGLFNGSVRQVFNKVSSLPPPPPEAFKIFKGGWLALRFTKAEQEKSR